MVDGDTEESIQRRMPLRQAPAARVRTRLIGNHGFAAAHDRTEQGPEFREGHAAGSFAIVEAAGGVIPGDIGDGVGLQIRGPLRRSKHLTDKAVPALRERQEVFERRLEGAVAVIDPDELGLGPGDYLFQLPRLNQRMSLFEQSGLTDLLVDSGAKVEQHLDVG